MKNRLFDYVFATIGVLLFAAGLYFVKTLTDPQGVMRALPYVCIGVGCGVFGHAMGNLLFRRTMMKNPDKQKQVEIERNDERSTAITNRAKAKAFDMMTYVYGALMLSFALMGTDMASVLLLVFAYLFVEFYGVYYRSKLEKEM